MQSKFDSAKEQIVRTAVNYFASCLVYLWLFPGSSFSSNWLKGLWFVMQSFVVGYAVRRAFNK